MFEQIILENSSEKQAKLLGPAQRAHKKPDIGVEIQNKSAYYVIRDCAMITQKYLVEYREDRGGLLRFYKERIDTMNRANEIREELLVKGYHDPVIKKVG